MSDMVHTLAQQLYEQFEKLIKKYDQHVVEELMPLVISILDAMENTHLVHQEQKTELDVLREDNEQLLNQYEREKEHRKKLDKRIIEMEDMIDEENIKKQEKLESLEALVRMLEMKAKNATDQAKRLEEKNAEVMMEFEKLHERYAQLLKSHVDCIERTRILQSGFPDRNSPFISRKNEAKYEPLQMENQELSEPVLFQSLNTFISDTEMLSLFSKQRALQRTASEPVRIPTPAQLYHMSTASYSEMNMDHDDMTSDGHRERKHDMDSDTESDLGAQESDSDRFLAKNQSIDSDEKPTTSDPFLFELSRQVEELLTENAELVATKNALNVVKDDLIAQLDELNSEHGMVREEMHSLEDVNRQLKESLSLLDESQRKMREDYEMKLTAATDQSQPKRFTRTEISHVAAEKKKYQEHLMELKRRTKVNQSGNSQGTIDLWTFFSSLKGNEFLCY